MVQVTFKFNNKAKLTSENDIIDYFSFIGQMSVNQP